MTIGIFFSKPKQIGLLVFGILSDFSDNLVKIKANYDE